MIPLSHYLILSSIIFFIGMVGFLVRRNVLIVLMSLELMLNAVNINLVAFSNHLDSMRGEIFVIFIIAVAAAEAAVGLALVVAVFRIRRSIDVDKFSLMRG